MPPAASAPSAAQMPSPSLLANFRQELSRYPPFLQMDAASVDFFLVHCEQRYYAPGQVLAEPALGQVTHIFFIREGSVTRAPGPADAAGGAFEFEAGELFPIDAALARRSVTGTYTATADTFVLALPCAAMSRLSSDSPVFADFAQRRVAGFLELSRQALQVAYASQALAQQSLETPLGELVQRAPVACGPDTPLRDVLERMHAGRVGSMLVVDAQGAPVGIFTRHDVIGRITLAGLPLDAPVARVMTQPVHALTAANTALDAALLMSMHGIRHVPVTRGVEAIGLVSERDLFAMQRLSLKQLSTSIRAAPSLASLRPLAQDVRQFARNLLGQGMQARQITALISHLNDALTQRLLQLKAAEHGIDLATVCWLALGSEGRGEQTIATDQDNALILGDGISGELRQKTLAFAKDVNLALDACGYPLCQGGIMAGEASCCLTLGEWRERFARWIEHGSPQDLLNASIYFDLRGLAGDERLAHQLLAEVLEAARGTPRFLKQMAQNALLRSVPLTWLGGVGAGERGTIDLKLQGTAVFVDAARLFGLAHGLRATSTRERLSGAGARLGLAPAEYEAWAAGFEFLQMLRLRVQLDSPLPPEPNRLEVATLNHIDRLILKESFRVARSLQQRLRLDYER